MQPSLVIHLPHLPPPESRYKWEGDEYLRRIKCLIDDDKHTSTHLTPFRAHTPFQRLSCTSSSAHTHTVFSLLSSSWLYNSIHYQQVMVSGPIKLPRTWFSLLVSASPRNLFLCIRACVCVCVCVCVCACACFHLCRSELQVTWRHLKLFFKRSKASYEGLCLFSAFEVYIVI